MGHGFGLNRHCALRPLAVSLATAGYPVLVFDYRHLGDSEGEPRQLISIRKQIEDWRAAIEFMSTRSEIRSSALVTWGFSLGAGHALTIASTSDRVQAVVAVAPMLDGLSSTLAAMKGWSLPTLATIAARGTLDLIGAPFGAKPRQVPLAAPPGELGLLTSPDAHSGYEALAPESFDFNTLARVAVVFWMYRPKTLLRSFDKPLLAFLLRPDLVNPPKSIRKALQACDRHTAIDLDCHHLEVLVEPHRTRVAEATVAFLRDHVPIQ